MFAYQKQDGRRLGKWEVDIKYESVDCLLGHHADCDIRVVVVARRHKAYAGRHRLVVDLMLVSSFASIAGL